MLTRRYGLDKEMIMDFFRESHSGTAMRFLWQATGPGAKHTGTVLPFRKPLFCVAFFVYALCKHPVLCDIPR